jgi:pyruvate formate lyase activating enzyme
VAVVLANLAWLIECGARVKVRTPVVPGFNDDRETIRALDARVAGLGLREIHFLPFHRLGQPRDHHLGRTAAWPGEDGVHDTQLGALADAASAHGIGAAVAR